MALQIVYEHENSSPSNFIFHLQIALDETAFLLDLASVEGTWDDFVERIAECYKDAGLQDIAKFVLYRD